MNTDTLRFDDDEFLSAHGLYVLASLGGNTMHIPAIDFPKQLDVAQGLIELNPKYLVEDEITELGKEVITAIEWIQRSQMCVMVNEATLFYSAQTLPVTVVAPHHIETQTYRLAHRHKTAELLGLLGGFSWLNTPLKKTEIVKKQHITVKEVIQHFESRDDSLAVSIFENNNLIYNSVFIPNEGAVVKYDEMTSTIEEKAGRDWIIELMQMTKFGNEFDIDTVPSVVRGGF